MPIQNKFLPPTINRVVASNSIIIFKNKDKKITNLIKKIILGLYCMMNGNQKLLMIHPSNLLNTLSDPFHGKNNWNKD